MKYICPKCTEEWDVNYCVYCSSTIDRSVYISQNKQKVSDKSKKNYSINLKESSKSWSYKTSKSKENDKLYKMAYRLLRKGKKNVKEIEKELLDQGYKGNVRAFLNEVESDIWNAKEKRGINDIMAGSVLFILGIFFAVVGSAINESTGRMFYFPVIFIIIGMIRLIRGAIKLFRNKSNE